MRYTKAMGIIIDGYNLIGAHPHISLSDPDKEKKLTNWLLNQTQSKSAITLVFDNHNPLNTYGNKEQVAHITIQYTAHGLTADEHIMQRLKELKGEKQLIISSDRAIKEAAKRQRQRSMDSQDFISSINKISKTTAIESKPEGSKTDTEYWLKQFQSQPSDRAK